MPTEALRSLRHRLEMAVDRLIDALDQIDAPTEELEDTGDDEDGDTGIADEDALALLQRATPFTKGGGA